ncbi:hypothetical protein SCL_0105 [Sulfuricaulis limicola]|uniref:Uncharacterized protein n=1 Tax=Sulfuricaulis limicola TaxID=1620215 RepID=A0A1B4XC74_9GAMM|nr:hypothetical protein [Sulfuricaulis limicola]BAV32429.1 hypothetical protein SCL_0105 [Sulfuricaulis limicola]
MISQIITTIGLACDIVGALLVANEVVRVFREPTTIDTGGSGHFGGAFQPTINPTFEQHEKKKHHIMKIGLVFLILGFVLQGVGAWWPIFYAT